MVDVLAEHFQRRCGPLVVGDPVASPLQRGDGHVRQLVGDGVGAVAVGPEPSGDPVPHADHAQRGDPGVDGPEPARAHAFFDDTGDRA